MSISDEGKRLSKREVAKIKEGFSNFLKSIVSFVFTAVGVGLGILIVYTTGMTDPNAFAGIVIGCGLGMGLVAYGLMELISRARMKGKIRRKINKRFSEESTPMVIEENALLMNKPISEESTPMVIEENALLMNKPISEELDKFEPLVYNPISNANEIKEQLIKTFPALIRHVEKGSIIKLIDIEKKFSIEKEVVIEALLFLLNTSELSATLDVLNENLIIN